MFIRKRTGKLSAALLVSAVTLSSVSAFPMQGFAASDATFIFHDTFESGDGGWSGRGGCTVKTSSDMPYEGNSALFVSGRSDAWNGPEKALSSVCEPGKTYSISVCVEYESGSETQTFQLSVAYKDASGEAVYDHLAQAETMSGSYVQLANTEYKLPSDATDAVLYVETLKGSGSFYIDEVICAEAGTVIEGPKPVKFTLGDVDFDGAITAADLSLAKCYNGKDFPNKKMLRAADVNQNGSVTEDDIRWYVQYLTGQTAEYPEKVAPPVKPFDYDPNLQYHPFDEGVYLSKSSHPGKVIEEHYNGTTGQNTLYVYLPDGYDESQQYNIFYLLYGGGENEKTLFFQDDTMMQNIFDHMIENGDMEPMIVVTPTWNQTGAEGFWQEYRERVVPFVEGKYSTYAETTDQAGLQASRMHRAYGGFSMGAVSTWAVITHCLDITGYFMPLSGDEWEGTNSAYDKAKKVADAVDKSGLQKDEYYIFCATGSDDIAYPNLNPQVQEMKKMSQFVYTSDLSQGNFYFLVAQGKQHAWSEVRHYVYDILPYFFHEKQN